MAQATRKPLVQDDELTFAQEAVAQLMLEPARLRQLGYSVEGLIARVEAIAFSKLSAGDESTLRAATPRPWDPVKAAAELSFLADPQQTPPATIPMCAQAVARRLQLDYPDRGAAAGA